MLILAYSMYFMDLLIWYRQHYYIQLTKLFFFSFYTEVVSKFRRDLDPILFFHFNHFALVLWIMSL